MAVVNHCLEKRLRCRFNQDLRYFELLEELQILKETEGVSREQQISVIQRNLFLKRISTIETEQALAFISFRTSQISGDPYFQHYTDRYPPDITEFDPHRQENGVYKLTFKNKSFDHYNSAVNKDFYSGAITFWKYLTFFLTKSRTVDLLSNNITVNYANKIPTANGFSQELMSDLFNDGYLGYSGDPEDPEDRQYYHPQADAWLTVYRP